MRSSFVHLAPHFLLEHIVPSQMSQVQCVRCLFSFAIWSLLGLHSSIFGPNPLLDSIGVPFVSTSIFPSHGSIVLGPTACQVYTKARPVPHVSFFSVHLPKKPWTFIRPYSVGRGAGFVLISTLQCLAWTW